MKKVVLLAVFFALFSCESIQYDGEKRLVFQTTVLNSSNQPLPNSPVEITISNDFGPGGGLISLGKTDQNGKITLIFPYPEGEYHINAKIYNDNLDYMTREILNIDKTDFENFKFIYQNAYLLQSDETAPLQLAYNHTTGGTVIKKISINGIYHMAEEYYNNYSGDTFYPLPNEISLKKNQSFQLKYTVYNTQTAAGTDHVVDLQIGDSPLDYTINY